MTIQSAGTFHLPRLAARAVALLLAACALAAAAQDSCSGAACDGHVDRDWADAGTTLVSDINAGLGTTLAVGGGKTVVVTTCQLAPDVVSACVYRLDRDGSLDTEFGVGGRAALMQMPGALHGIETEVQTIVDVASVAPDGHVVILALGASHTWLVRLRGDGKAIDGTFVDPLPGSSPIALLVQHDGKIVVTGYGFPGQPTYSSVARIKADLSGYDTGFGNNGFSMLDPAPGYDDALLVALGETGSHALVLAGGATPNGQTYDVGYVARLTPAGSYDAGFNGNGRYEDSYSTGFTDLVTVRRDRVYVVGSSGFGGNWSMRVLGFRGDGSLLGSNYFGTDSCGTTDDHGYAITVQPDARLVVAGYCVTAASQSVIELVRLSFNVSLDASFGSGPAGYTLFAPLANTLPNSVLVANGGILLDWSDRSDLLHRHLTRFRLDEIFPSGFEAWEE